MDFETYKRLSQESYDAMPAPEGVYTADIDPAALSSTVGRASAGLQQNIGETASVVGRLTDSPELQSWGEDMTQGGQEYGSYFGQAPTQYVTDIENVGDAGQWAQEVGVGGAVSSLPPLAAAIVPAFFKFNKLAMAAAAVAGYGMNLGEVSRSLQEADPGTNHDKEALGIAGAMAVPEAVGAGVVLAPMIKRAGKEATTARLLKSGMKPADVAKVVEEADLANYIGHTIKGSVAEGVTEVTQDAMRMSGVAQVTDTALPENMGVELINSFAGGMGAGGIASTTVSAIEGGAEAAAHKLTPILDKATEFLQDNKAAAPVLQFLGSAGINRVRPYAKHSPALQQIVDMFVPDQSGQRAVGATIDEQKQLNIGKAMSTLEQSGLMNMDADAAYKEFQGYSQGERDTPQKLAIESVFKDIEKRGVEAGLLDKGLENYLSTHTDMDKIAANREQFISDITPYYTNKDGTTVDKEGMRLAEKALIGYERALEKSKDSDTSLPRVDRTYLEENENGDLVVAEKYRKKEQEDQLKYKIGQGQRAPKAKKLEGHRYFKKVPQHVLNNWSKEVDAKSMLQSIRDYVEQSEHRLTGVDKMGANGEKLSYLLAKASQELAAQGMRLPKHIADRVYDIADAHNGVLNLPRDKAVRSAVGNAVSVTNMIKLPLSGISSISEFMLAGIQGEMGTMLKGIFPMVQQNVVNILDGVTNQVPRSEMSKLAADMNITYKAAINTMAERTNDAMLGGAAATAGKWFYQLNGQTPLLHAYRVGAVVQGHTIVKRNLLTLASGANPKSQKATYYRNQLRTLGIDIETREQAMELYAPQGEGQRQFAEEKIALAVRRFVDMSHFDPTASNTALWMHDGNFKAFSGLKKYASALTNNLMPQIARKFNSNYTGGGLHAGGAMTSLVGTMAAMLVFGAGMDYFKRYLRGKGGETDNRTLVQKWVDVASLSWAPLPASFLADLIGAARYGKSFTEVAVGPLGGTIDDLMPSITKLAEDPTKGHIWDVFVKATPLNTFKAHFE